MRIFGFVVLREKKYLQTVSAWESMVRDYQTKIGALEFDKKELQKKLKDAEIRIEQLEEMNDGLWEMRGITDEGRID
ncbi:MAG: hypothetical protein IJC82_05560 [Firmicutes bacterium]|nr:hypothetical protein [Bacillota bacterium]